MVPYSKKDKARTSVILTLTLLWLTKESRCEYPFQSYYENYYDFDLKENITAYISQFQSQIKQEVVSFHLTACPYTPLCNFSLGLTIPQGYSLTCEQCRCDFACLESKSCCPDMVPDEYYDEPGQDISMDTDELAEQYDNEICLMFFGFVHTKCLNSDFNEICTDGYRFDMLESYDILSVIPVTTMIDILDIVPVSSKSNGVTFLNRQCAECLTDDMEFWETHVICKFRNWYPDSTWSLRWMIQTLSSHYCELKFHSDSFTTSTCRKLVNGCKPSDTGSSVRKSDKVGCSAYQSLVKLDNAIYRNINCFQCNDNSRFPPSLQETNKSEVYSFIGKLDYSSLRNEMPTNQTNITFTLDYAPLYEGCPHSQMYDQFMDKCLEAGCSPLMIQYEGTCRPLYTVIDRTVYYSFITLTSHTEMVLTSEYQLHNVYDDCVVGALDEFKIYILNELGLNITLKLDSVYATNRKQSQPSHFPVSITDVLVELIFHFQNAHPVSIPIDVMTNMKHLSQLTCNIGLNNTGSTSTDHVLSVHNVNDYRWNFLSELSYTRKTYGIPHHIYLRELNREYFTVFTLTPCLFVKVCHADINWNETFDGLWFPDFGQMVNATEFYFPLNELDCIMICQDTLHHVVTSTLALTTSEGVVLYQSVLAVMATLSFPSLFILDLF